MSNTRDLNIHLKILAVAALLWSQLDGAADFEERRLIRAALRDLLKKKRGILLRLGVGIFQLV